VEHNFIDSFEIFLSNEYINENEDICVIACGPMVAEAIRAAWILKQEYNIETRVVNIHTLKPIDKDCLLKAAEEIGQILTIEEQQVGGFGNIVAGIIAQGKRFSKSFMMDMVGINDHFGESGAPWDLMKAFGLSAEQISVRAKKLFDIE
jgi:transketolase